MPAATSTDEGMLKESKQAGEKSEGRATRYDRLAMHFCGVGTLVAIIQYALAFAFGFSNPALAGPGVMFMLIGAVYIRLANRLREARLNVAAVIMIAFLAANVVDATKDRSQPGGTRDRTVVLLLSSFGATTGFFFTLVTALGRETTKALFAGRLQSERKGGRQRTRQ